MIKEAVLAGGLLLGSCGEEPKRQTDVSTLETQGFEDGLVNSCSSYVVQRGLFIEYAEPYLSGFLKAEIAVVADPNICDFIIINSIQHNV